MKRAFVLMIAMLAMSSFVFAVGSEVSADFVVGAPKEVVQPYVPSSSGSGDYLSYVVVIVIILIVIYSLKNKRVPVKKKVVKSRVSKKKISKKKVSKKKSARKKK